VPSVQPTNEHANRQTRHNNNKATHAVARVHFMACIGAHLLRVHRWVASARFFPCGQIGFHVELHSSAHSAIHSTQHILHRHAHCRCQSAALPCSCDDERFHRRSIEIISLSQPPSPRSLFERSRPLALRICLLLAIACCCCVGIYILQLHSIRYTFSAFHSTSTSTRDRIPNHSAAAWPRGFASAVMAMRCVSCRCYRWMSALPIVHRLRRLPCIGR
jgi:hypothetical protein